MILFKDGSKTGLIPKGSFKDIWHKASLGQAPLLLAADCKALRTANSLPPHAGLPLTGQSRGMRQPDSSSLPYCTLAEQAPNEAETERQAGGLLIPDLSSSSSGACR